MAGPFNYSMSGSESLKPVIVSLNLMNGWIDSACGNFAASFLTCFSKLSADDKRSVASSLPQERTLNSLS